MNKVSGPQYCSVAAKLVKRDGRALMNIVTRPVELKEPEDLNYENQHGFRKRKMVPTELYKHMSSCTMCRDLKARRYAGTRQTIDS